MWKARDDNRRAPLAGSVIVFLIGICLRLASAVPGFGDPWIVGASEEFNVGDDGLTLSIPERNYREEKTLAFILKCNPSDGCGSEHPFDDPYSKSPCYFTDYDGSLPSGFFDSYIQSNYTADGKYYELTLAENIDKEVENQNELPWALLCGNPESTTFQESRVEINNVNDNQPRIEDPYEASVEENKDYSRAGEPILDFKTDATNFEPSDGDGDVLYYFIEDRYKNEFEIISEEQGFAKLHKIEPFDFEARAYYNIRVTVQDRGESDGDTLSATTLVRITVTDVQDRKPQFVQTQSSITLEDGMKAGEPLGTFKAEDGDTPEIARSVTYSIEGDVHQLFTMKTERVGASATETVGKLSLRDDFDLESFGSDFQPFIQLQVKAKEDGADDGDENAASTFPAFVAVRDIDDNPPRFLNPEDIRLLIFEHDSGFTQNFTVIDDDYDLKGYRVEIETVPASIQVEKNAFRASPTHGFKETPFILTVSNDAALDYEDVDAREIQVIVKVIADEAADEAQRWTIYVELQDENDQIPQFIDEPGSYEITIPEGLKGETILKINATDDDETEDFGTSSIRYSLYATQETIRLFTIDEITGEIETSREDTSDFDFGIKKHTLTIFARDGGETEGIRSNQNEVDVIIHLDNVNDEPPEFLPSLGTIFSIFENATDEPIIQDMAQHVRDPDYGADDACTVKFGIDWSQSTASLNNVPVTLNLSSTFKTMLGNNGEWTLVAMQGPDRELVDTIRLSLTVSDEGTAPEYPEKKTASQVITIEVEDVNDCEPVITIPDSNYSIPEQVMTGRVITFSIDDDDRTTPNDEFEPHFESEQADYFDLDCRGTGDCDVKWTKAFDREVTSQVTVTFWAIDKGNPPLVSEKLSVTIFIEDVNDNRPEWVNLQTDVEPVPENTDIGTTVYTLEATDSDSGINQKLCYEVWERNNRPPEVTEMFSIDKTTGEIKVHQKLDRERFPEEMTLSVVVYDKCEEDTTEMPFDSKYNIMEVRIQLTDINDEPPVFPEQTGDCFFTLDEIAPEGTRAEGFIKADDPDEISTLAYQIDKIVSQTDGTEMAGTGMTIVDGPEQNSALLAVVGENTWVNRWGRYDVHLTVTDEAAAEGSQSDSTVYVMCVNNVNNNAPVFTKPLPEDREISVLNTHPWGQNEPVVPTGQQAPVEVQATDDDDASLKYTVVSGDGYFNVKQTDDGAVVVLTKSLEDQVGKSFVMVIRADDTPPPPTDSERPPSEITLIFKVTDEANDPPVLGEEGQHQLLSIMENEPVFWALVNRGIDQEGDPIFYHLVGGAREYFDLDPEAGNLTLKEPLDREENPTLTLVVRVYAEPTYPTTEDESFDEERKDLLEIVIEVQDQKDVAATFGRQFTGAITSDAGPGRIVARIDAVDPDVNLEPLSFRIESVIPADPTLQELTIADFEIREIKEEPLQADIIINFTPQIDMRGSVVLKLQVWDPEDQDPTVGRGEAVLTMVNPDNQVRLIFLNYYKEVEQKRDKLVGVVQAKIGDPLESTAMIDKIAGSDSTARASNTTEVLIHLEKTGSEIVESSLIRNLLQDPAKGAEIMEACRAEGLDFFTYYVGQPRIVEEDTIKTTYFYASVAIGALAIVATVVLALLYMRHTSNLKRQVKAMTTNTFGSQDSGMNRLGLELPNTNAFAMEGSNPLHNVADAQQILDDASSTSGDSILIGVEDNPEFSGYDAKTEQTREAMKKKRPAPPIPVQHMGIMNPAYSKDKSDFDVAREDSGYGDFGNHLGDEDPFGGGQRRTNPLLALGAAEFDIGGDDAGTADDFSFGLRNL